MAKKTAKRVGLNSASALSTLRTINKEVEAIAEFRKAHNGMSPTEWEADQAAKKVAYAKHLAEFQVDQRVHLEDHGLKLTYKIVEVENDATSALYGQLTLVFQHWTDAAGTQQRQLPVASDHKMVLDAGWISPKFKRVSISGHVYWKC